MRNIFPFILILMCFAALFLCCYAPVFFADRQFGYRDVGHFYYPLHQRVQQEWNAGRWPLWEPEENGGMPLLGNPTAAVFYPGKLVFAMMPYAGAARVYVVSHTALAFVTMLVLMRGWGTSWVGSTLSALAYAFGAPILFQYCNIIYLIGAAWLPLGMHAVDRWVRLSRRWGLFELSLVLAMQMLGGDPQAAYLLGLAAGGYALGVVWSRAGRNNPTGAEGVEPARVASWLWWSVPTIAIGVVVWCGVTLILAKWLPTLRELKKPPPPLPGMLWVPFGVNAAWGLAALPFLYYWCRRGWRFRLRLMGLGLAMSAGLAAALTAVQLFPVIEFTQLTTRAAGGGPHDMYPFSLPPIRIGELLWPNISGIQLEGNYSWAQSLKLPGYKAKVWVPSLYLGGLTLVLAVSALGFRKGPSWRAWLSAIVLLSLVGSLGEYTSPIGMARTLADKTGAFRHLVAGIGPLDPVDYTPIRQDGFLRDGDGGVYWLLTTVLPGFRQFRFPSKLFTFTSLGIAALAGLGWDQLRAGRTRVMDALLLFLLLVTTVVLAGVLLKQDAIKEALKANPVGSLFGPFSADGALRVIVQALIHALIVLGIGLVVSRLVRRQPALAGAIALIAMTTDLAVANSRLIFTVPQSIFETRPEVLKIIENAEREKPSPGPFRVHRMPLWNPGGWQKQGSPDRIKDFVTWERDTLQPKYGINFDIEYTHTLGVAELYDYEWYFGGFYRIIRDKAMAEHFKVEVGTEVVYFPRRAFDMWNTRYFVLPYHPGGWREEGRGYASFVFQSEAVYPEPERFQGKKGADLFKDWLENHDFQVQRNLQECPRAWVVHEARRTRPLTELSRENREAALQEIVYADDPIWHDANRHAFDPRRVAWVNNDVIAELGPFLSGRPPRISETVKVNYPSPQCAVLDVSLESPGLVVLADVYYPGWELTINGKPAPIYRVNHLMRGAAVSAGRSRLVYTYKPRSFLVGRVVSILGLAVLVILALVCFLKPVNPAHTAEDAPVPAAGDESSLMQPFS
jgi:hypothetical protein